MVYQAVAGFICRAVLNDCLEQVLVPFLVYKDWKEKVSQDLSKRTKLAKLCTNYNMATVCVEICFLSNMSFIQMKKG